MDIIEDFGPLLIIALSALFAYFKEKGKGNEENQAHSNPQETYLRKQERIEPKRHISTNDMPGDLYDDKREHLEKATTTNNIVAEPENEYVIRDIDELKRAIIYSEILNRKY
jgi:hypothetical protein